MHLLITSPPHLSIFLFEGSSRPKSSKKVSKDGKESSAEKRESTGSSSSRPKSAAKRRDEGLIVI
jgi:hypothetical protein